MFENFLELFIRLLFAFVLVFICFSVGHFSYYLANTETVTRISVLEKVCKSIDVKYILENEEN